MIDRISVLDEHGYVRYVKHMGSDLDVVNSARVSYDKESTSFEDRDKRLLAFLARDVHTSVLRHSVMTFEIYAPLLVCRQWWKYAVASSHLESQNGHNESSRRYVTETPTFHIPKSNEWRTKPKNSKQGSGDPIDIEEGSKYTKLLDEYIQRGVELYEQAMEANIAAEQARLFLPAYGMYIRWRWTASLDAIIHMLSQRLEHDAQKEFQVFAVAVKNLVAEHFPQTIAAFFPEP